MHHSSPWDHGLASPLVQTRQTAKTGSSAGRAGVQGASQSPIYVQVGELAQLVGGPRVQLAMVEDVDDSVEALELMESIYREEGEVQKLEKEEASLEQVRTTWKLLEEQELGKSTGSCVIVDATH